MEVRRATRTWLFFVFSIIQSIEDRDFPKAQKIGATANYSDDCECYPQFRADINCIQNLLWLASNLKAPRTKLMKSCLSLARSESNISHSWHQIAEGLILDFQKDSGNAARKFKAAIAR